MFQYFIIQQICIKCLLPDIVLGSEDIAMNRVDKNASLL